jgi:transcriptional regulator with XRE-family HTH domain
MTRSPIEHRAAVGALLRELRREADLTQNEVADRLERAQSYVSKYETGELRLDVLELREVLLAIGASLEAFVERLERQLKTIGPGTRPQRL